MECAFIYALARMFTGVSAFNQYIGEWDVDLATDCLVLIFEWTTVLTVG